MNRITAALAALTVALTVGIQPAHADNSGSTIYGNYRKYAPWGSVYSVMYYGPYQWQVKYLDAADWTTVGMPGGTYQNWHGIPVTWESTAPPGVASNTVGYAPCYSMAGAKNWDGGIHLIKPYFDANPRALPNVLRHEYMHVLQCRSGNALNEYQADAGAVLQGSAVDEMAYFRSRGTGPTDEETRFARYFLDWCEDAYGTAKPSGSC